LLWIVFEQFSPLHPPIHHYIYPPWIYESVLQFNGDLLSLHSGDAVLGAGNKVVDWTDFLPFRCWWGRQEGKYQRLCWSWRCVNQGRLSWEMI
jgi:hypothetical protein